MDRYEVDAAAALRVDNRLIENNTENNVLRIVCFDAYWL